MNYTIPNSFFYLFLFLKYSGRSIESDRPGPIQHFEREEFQPVEGEHTFPALSQPLHVQQHSSTESEQYKLECLESKAK